MKRPNSSDSLGALMSICPNSSVNVDEKKQENKSPMYARDFQTMVQGGFDDEECCQLLVSEKKRRLGVDQVKALEKNFEVENKLEPERKVKLAQELGLQPRQVAVWFQNRRARWKTKQLERDYGLLKANHDALNRKFHTLQKENESLLDQIRELKSKLNNDEESKIRVKAEPSLASGTDREKTEIEENGVGDLELNNTEVIIGCATSAFSDLKDGVLSSDDSDSSAILNNEDINTNSPNDQFLDIENGPSPNSSYALDMNFGFSDCKASAFVKIEEHSFLDEESCSSLFSDDQAPTLHWYCSDEWK